jgi:hypothetical protein
MHRRSSHLASTLFLFLVAVLGVNAHAQDRHTVHFKGLINDYTPSTVKGGPYEMRGSWSLNVHPRTGKADFSAELNMETSDYGTQNGVVDATNPVTRNAHTHHIMLTNALVLDGTGCPTSTTPPSAKPLTTTGFRISGTVSLMTGNGQRAPFEAQPPQMPTSTLTVCVTGGSDVSYSNVTLEFGAPANTHFGTQAIHGVVRSVSDSDGDDRGR